MRLFFAAWPAPAVQQALHGVAQRARRECGGRAVALPNIHLTLVFLGSVDRASLREIEAIAAGVDGTACDLVVEHVAYWRHNRILWAGVEHCPDALLDVVRQLSAGARDARIELDERPYVPHVTLLRNARRGPGTAVVPSIIWPVRDIALVESAARDGGRSYEVVGRWPLKPQRAGLPQDSIAT